MDALNQGSTPDQVMQNMGIMSGSQAAPEVVVDQEKMREFEERLNQEKEEIRLKAEADR